MVQFGNREADERCASSCGVAKATVAITASRDGSSCIIQDKRPLICQAHSLQEDKDVEPETPGCSKSIHEKKARKHSFQTKCT